MSLPPPPQFTGAPGQQPYENGTTNGSGNPAHMPPPPLPPVVIPQNTNPIPTAMTSPGGDSNGMLSPSSGSGSFVRRAAPEPNKRALYVGGLDPRVTEDILRQIFETTGHVQNVKIIPDKNMGAVSRDASLPAVSFEIPYSLFKKPTTRAQDKKRRATEFSFHSLLTSRVPHPSHTPSVFAPHSHICMYVSSSWLNTSRARDLITVSLNTTIQHQQNEPCRLSTVVASIKL